MPGFLLCAAERESCQLQQQQTRLTDHTRCSDKTRRPSYQPHAQHWLAGFWMHVCLSREKRNSVNLFLSWNPPNVSANVIYKVKCHLSADSTNLCLTVCDLHISRSIHLIIFYTLVSLQRRLNLQFRILLSQSSFTELWGNRRTALCASVAAAQSLQVTFYSFRKKSCDKHHHKQTACS